MRLLLCLAVVGVCACKTAQPKDDTTPIAVAIDDSPSPPPEETKPAGAAAAAPGAVASPLEEPLTPVRGGAVVLPPYRGPDPCRMALAGQSPVAKACSDGGLRKAMEMMQTFVRRAQAEGIAFACTDCHTDDEDYSKLAPHADAEFRKLLFLARPE